MVLRIPIAQLCENAGVSKLKRKRADVLLVGQTPPPFHGQAAVTSMLFEGDWEEMEVERLRMAFSSSIGEVGSASLGKFFHLCSLVFQTWKVLIFRRPRILYYLPASPGLVPVIRDIFYLGAVRWFFQKTVFHYHAGGLDEFVRQRWWLVPIARLVYGRADISIEVNEWLKPAGQFFKARRNTTVMNGVKPVIPERRRRETGFFQFLYVGMLCEEKGVGEIIEMVAELKSRNYDCEARFVGDWVSGSFRDEMLSKVEMSGLRDRIDWAGVLHGDEKWQAYVDADIFIFPSHHPTETFGMVLIEAMACELPLITTRWRGIPNVVGESGCAELCEVNSPLQYADAASKLMGDPEHLEKMKEASVERYRMCFTEDRFLSKMKEEFRSLLH